MSDEIVFVDEDGVLPSEEWNVLQIETNNIIFSYRKNLSDYKRCLFDKMIGDTDSSFQDIAKTYNMSIINV